jgi:anaerobic magnesium-protoporphyrin IX monomethyl ester cyclase
MQTQASRSEESPRTRASSSSSSLTVALVGREQPGDENLALRYLAAALKRAGHRPLIVPLCGPADILDAVAIIQKSGASLVGVSVSDADVAIDSLAFLRYLRKSGYTGHVTCGGALATLGRHELLDKHPEIDSIVRYDGEMPLVLLAHRLAQQLAFDDVPAITTRAGDGPPAPVVDRTPICIEPVHPNPLPRIIGLPVARLVASRGCPGRCSYCSPAAIQREAVREGLAAGHSAEALRRAGVGGTRRRAPADLADEIARLYHESGARLFHMLDDNMLSGAPELNEWWLATLITELQRRNVGRIAWSLQAEPSSLTPRVLDLLQQLGVVRIAVGVEALTAEQLRALGRNGDVGAHRRLLEELKRRAIVAVFNSLLVHPEATVAGIEAELDALSTLQGIHFDAFAMAIYPGTLAHHRLADADRVTGGLLGLHYRIADPAVARFRAALIQLRVQGIRRYGINVFAHDVGLNLALARHFGLNGYAAGLQHALDDAMREMNELRVGAWRQALAMAQTELTIEARQQAVWSLIASVRRDLAPIWQCFDRVQLRLEASAPPVSRRSNLLVMSALAAGVTLLVGPSACGGIVGLDAGNAGLGGAGAGAMAGAGGTVGTGGSTAHAGGSTAAATSSVCSADQKTQQQTDVTSYVDQACGLPTTYYGCPSAPAYGIVIDAQGHATDIVVESDAGVPPLTDELRSCYLEALAPHTFPCLAGDTAEIWTVCVVCLF